jgi:hypothetical protein
MSANSNSTIVIILGVLGILSAASVIRFVSKATNVPVGMKSRLILRRVSFILLLTSGIIGLALPRGTILERAADASMLFFAFVYAAFPLYSLAGLLVNSIRGKTGAHTPEPQ